MNDSNTIPPDKNFLFEEAIRYRNKNVTGFPGTIIEESNGNGKVNSIKKPTDEFGPWTVLRGKTMDDNYYKTWFIDHANASYLGIVLDSSDLLVGLDIDKEGEQVMNAEILPKLSVQLQNKFNRTTRTRTPNGNHKLFRIKREDFPSGVGSVDVWTDPNGGHSEIKFFGTNKMFFERGPGYECIIGIESIETLEKDELKQLRTVCDELKEKKEVVNRVSSHILKYWQEPSRDKFVMSLSGYLHKNSDVPETLCDEIFTQVINHSSYNDENLAKTLDTIHNSYELDKKNDFILGYLNIV